MSFTRSIGLALAALAIAIAAPTVVLAPGVALSKNDAPSVSKDSRKKGMAAAPGIVSEAGYDCQVADARFIGESVPSKDHPKAALYEVVCNGNEGLIIQKPATGPAAAFTCAETDQPQANGKPSTLACILPGNLDPKAGLAPYIAKAGIACTPEKLRALGHNATVTAFEVACQGGRGYILQTSAPPNRSKPVVMEPCMAIPTSDSIQCTLTSKAEETAFLQGLVAQAKTPCTITSQRYVGAAPTGDVYYEVACQGGKGYMVQTASNGSFKDMIGCAQAAAIGGGCTLTNAREAETAQAGIYTDLAHKAGFDCNVSKYADLPANVPGKEVVELACSNRPDGGIGIFPVAGAGSSEVLNCAVAELRGFRCSFTPPSADYPKLTATLRSLGKVTCQVSNTRAVGLAGNQGYVETACADGMPGYMIQYTLQPLHPVKAIACSEASEIGGGCNLPGDVKR